MKEWQFLTPEQSREILLRFVPKNSKILEAGCGTGLSGKAQHIAGYHNLYGCDISSEMLAEAKAKDIYQTLHQCNLFEPLPYEDSYFDVIECLAVLTHILDPAPIFLEFHRIVKTEGLIIFSHRNDLFENRNMIILLENLEQAGLFKKVYQSDWLPYVTNHDDYIKFNIRVGYFVYRKL